MFRLFVIALLLCPAVADAQSSQQEAPLPAFVLQLPASVANMLIVETGSSTLFEYPHHDGELGSPTSRYISIGQNGAGKQRAGDRRTPLGIYFINEQLDTSRLHEKYGPTAFSLDYPNEWDRLSERSGDGIWLHGVTPGSDRRPPLDTDGCVALGNSELLELAGSLRPLVTPVLITREIRWDARENIAATRADLNAALADWKQSLLAGDLHRYQSLYANDFRHWGMNRDDWLAYRNRSFAHAVDDVSLEDVVLLADPEEDGLYLSRFRQTVVETDRTVVTIKRLYWKRSVDGELKIVAEDNG
jgi:murein L,D-transpeptidase YafK